MIIFAVAGLLTVFWLLFRLTTLALPVYAGISAGLFAFQTDAGPLAAILIGFFAAAVVLAAGQTLFAAAHSPTLRFIAGLVFAIPAAVAGYSAVHGLAHLAGSNEVWQLIVGIIGAAMIGGVAWARLKASRPAEPSIAPRRAHVSSRVRLRTTSNG